MRARAAALALLCAALCAAAPARAAALDPIGTWNCLRYGPFGDERFYLLLSADGRAHAAGISEALWRSWIPLSAWRSSRGRLRFADESRQREYAADLDRATLGGTWSAPARTGGWWCARVGVVSGDGAAVRPPPSPAGLMQALVPAIMASPRYPRQAIREANEGRAVGCFFVHGNGEISEPHILESSDEIFREPTLVALSRSSYRPWGEEHAVLPACRTFRFELRAGG